MSASPAHGGDYLVSWDNQHFGMAISQCGPDWIKGEASKPHVKRNYPGFIRSAERYLEYLDQNPGACVIYFGNKHRGRQLNEVRDVNWVIFCCNQDWAQSRPLWSQCARKWLAIEAGRRTVLARSGYEYSNGEDEQPRGGFGTSSGSTSFALSQRSRSSVLSESIARYNKPSEASTSNTKREARTPIRASDEEDNSTSRTTKLEQRSTTITLKVLEDILSSLSSESKAERAPETPRRASNHIMPMTPTSLPRRTQGRRESNDRYAESSSDSEDEYIPRVRSNRPSGGRRAETSDDESE